MIGKRSPLFGMAILCANMTALNLVYALFSMMRNGEAATISPLITLAFTLSCYLLLHGISKKRGLSVSALIVIAGLFLAVQILCILLTQPPFAATMGLLFALAFWAAGYLRIYNLLQGSITHENMVISLEAGVAALLLGAVFTVRGFPTGPVLLLGIAEFLLLLAIIGQRTAGSGNKPVLSMSLFFCGITGGIFLLAAGIAMTTGSRLKLFFTDIISLLQTGFRKLDQWMGSLFPNMDRTPSGALPPAAETAGSSPETETIQLVESETLLTGFLIFLLCLLLLAALVLLLKGKHKMISPGEQHPPFVRLSRPRPWERLMRKLAYTKNRLFRPSSIPGIFAMVEWQERRDKQGRSPHETCRAFLIRTAKRRPQNANELLILADQVDLHFFGSGAALSSAERRSLRKALQKQKKETP